jgi:heme iron utilization protein
VDHRRWRQEKSTSRATGEIDMRTTRVRSERMSQPRDDAHASGGPSQEPLYDVTVPTPTHAERARTLVARMGTGTLSTVALQPAGFPYGSFVTFGLDAGAPVFLISEMAEHTRNLRADPRASLLVVEPGEGDPLARGRVTLVGACQPIDDAERGPALAAYLARHPRAAYHADFRDFHMWRLAVDAIRYIGGYGRMSWVDATAWSSAEADPLLHHAEGILAHMNQDHGAALLACCHAFTRAADASAATMTGVDRYGFEMSAVTAQGPRPIRLAFSRAVRQPEEVRRELVDLTQRARTELAKR